VVAAVGRREVFGGAVLLTALVNTQQALADAVANYEPMEVCGTFDHRQCCGIIDQARPAPASTPLVVSVGMLGDESSANSTARVGAGLRYPRPMQNSVDAMDTKPGSPVLLGMHCRL
jgi:hypothetical protein